MRFVSPVAAAGLVLGYLISRLQKSSKQLRDRLPELLQSGLAALWRLLLALLIVGAWAALLVLVVHTGRHQADKDIWSMVASAIFLLGLSLLLYTTGARRRTAKERIAIGGGGSTKVAPGKELSDDDYARLPRLEVEKVRSRYKAPAAFQIKRPAQDQEGRSHRRLHVAGALRRAQSEGHHHLHNETTSDLA